MVVGLSWGHLWLVCRLYYTSHVILMRVWAPLHVQLVVGVGACMRVWELGWGPSLACLFRPCMVYNVYT